MSSNSHNDRTDRKELHLQKLNCIHKNDKDDNMIKYDTNIQTKQIYWNTALNIMHYTHIITSLNHKLYLLLFARDYIECTSQNSLFYVWKVKHMEHLNEILGIILG